MLAHLSPLQPPPTVTHSLSVTEGIVSEVDAPEAGLELGLAAERCQ